jgi:hypothetical protein
MSSNVGWHGSNAVPSSPSTSKVNGQAQRNAESKANRATNGKLEKLKRDKNTDADSGSSGHPSTLRADSSGRMSMDFLLGGQEDASKSRANVPRSPRREEVRPRMFACMQPSIVLLCFGLSVCVCVCVRAVGGG